MSGSRGRSGGVGLVAAGLLMVLCCAGPLLVGAGALGAVGGALRNPWLISVAAVVAVMAVGYVLRCRAGRRRGAVPEDCCPPEPRPQGAHHPDSHVRSGDDAPKRRDIR
ncbi:hypothetical protein NLX86_10405 [Streptomyces sp. A3M-1-3]|uniref:hypothetical protein n=1 Tax=Streptomyces sp. A3M-1-3 TaxID=2962044 RepID=UPI0020B72C36|nr:hypothetical protein [Streptomyces sp. A3M-1-3]MCP3818514.1 hypothetical protein [Streptomyces sp. A3M-1-3]